MKVLLNRGTEMTSGDQHIKPIRVEMLTAVKCRLVNASENRKEALSSKRCSYVRLDVLVHFCEAKSSEWKGSIPSPTRALKSFIPFAYRTFPLQHLLDTLPCTRYVRWGTSPH